MTSKHTPTPWFVSGVRFKMNGGEWVSVNRYDEALKRDENIALVGYEPRTGIGRTDAAFIVRACNAHDELLEALKGAHKALSFYEWYDNPKSGWARPDNESLRGLIDAAIAKAEAP